jgi:hypothetical protein
MTSERKEGKCNLEWKSAKEQPRMKSAKEQHRMGTNSFEVNRWVTSRVEQLCLERLNPDQTL